MSTRVLCETTVFLACTRSSSSFSISIFCCCRGEIFTRTLSLESAPLSIAFKAA